jgi:hypothetical protein
MVLSLTLPFSKPRATRIPPSLRQGGPQCPEAVNRPTHNSPPNTSETHIRHSIMSSYPLLHFGCGAQAGGLPVAEASGSPLCRGIKKWAGG